MTAIDRYTKFNGQIDYVHNASFELPAAKKDILASMPRVKEFDEERRRIRLSEVPAHLKPYHSEPLLDKDQEVYLFRKFNFLKYQAKKIFDSICSTNPRISKLNAIDVLLISACEVKNQIAASNFRLTTQISGNKKYYRSEEDDRISQAYITILRAVDLFDYSRGWMFSTYATSAVFHSAIRDSKAIDKERERCVNTGLVDYDCYTTPRGISKMKRQQERTENNLMLSMDLHEMLGCLDARRKTIVKSYYGLGEIPVTLTKMGEDMGITKERVRQIREEGLAILKEQAVKMGWADGSK